ncbi:MAG: SRPBCC family protein [Sphingomicrobium sp.]
MQDAIHETIHIPAPVERVWKAISDHKEFGQWFRVRLDQPFVAGTKSTGQITVPGFDHIKWNADVVAVDPPTKLAFRWHPYAIDPETDYSTEPTTLVEFTLSERDGGTEVQVVESGFGTLPEHRRDEAFRMNSQGWAAQMKNVRQYLA